MSKTERLTSYIGSFDGYKLSNTHFKIGAKIHSNDFYYAKRLFQNSYYTARVALLLAMKIRDRVGEKESPLTLVGYEMYSELLLSLTKKFLNDFGYRQVNHFVTLDAEDRMVHQPDSIKINAYVVIIVPIASTGSTSKKIESYVRKLGSIVPAIPEQLFHFNILVAHDHSYPQQDLAQELPIVKLNTTWRAPEKCEWCFDDHLAIPLFETDKSSLVPSLIFDLPHAKIISDDISTDINLVNFKDALIYRKAKRNNEHFLYSTNTDLLIDKNVVAVNKWLEALSGGMSIKQTDKIVIISPCHYSNTKFINLVNDRLFHSSATIIHYQADEDYLSNFKLLNQNYLNEKDVKIFFVDDSLISGKNFFSIYDLFRYTTDYERPLVAAIFMSNKSSPDIHKRISRATKVYSFVNINLPLSPKIFNKKPLEHESKRYADLSKTVLHDIFKVIFGNKADDLKGLQSMVATFKPDGEEKAKRHEKMLRSTHKAYEFFHKKPKLEGLDFDGLLHSCGLNPQDIEDKFAMMKVLSQYPFLLYMPVRKKTFEWLKNWFINVSSNLLTKISGPIELPIHYEEFREIKFLIRRAVFLGYNRLVSDKFMPIIPIIFNKINNPNGIIHVVIESRSFFEQVSRKVELNAIETRNIQDFHIFLLEQYIELIQKNPWCAAKLNQNLEALETGFVTPQGKKFFRMLTTETTVVLSDFYALLQEKEDWLKLFEPETTQAAHNEDIILENDKIISFLEEHKEFHLSKKFLLADQTLGLIKNDRPCIQYLNYLWIKQFLGTDLKSNAPLIDLTLKTEAIFSKLKGLFDDNNEVGAFFIVTDGKKRHHLVYDRDSTNNQLLKELEDDRHGAILDFLKGEKDLYEIGLKSIKELEKTGNRWLDLYRLKEDEPIRGLSLPTAKWLLMIRIADNNSRTLGLMGFYSSDKLSDQKLAKQILMLLREDIGQFVRKHHKNDEFSFLREAETSKRFAYLAGHGRQMMQKLAKHDSEVFSAVVSTMEKLQYLFATKLISPSGYSDITKRHNDEELFNNIFLDNSINREVISEIRILGKEIFQSGLIENSVPLYQPEDDELDLFFNAIEVDEDFHFRFNSSILQFICFELFVNAKKNRFHFAGEVCPQCSISTNRLVANFTVHKGKLELKLAGTGPEVPESVREKINGGNNVKSEDEIAGLWLITKVIRFLNPKNRLKIESQPYKPCCGIFANTIILTLSQRNER